MLHSQNIRTFAFVLLTSNIAGYKIKTIPNHPLILGQAKVSNQTPGRRNPCMMGSLGPGEDSRSGPTRIRNEPPDLSTYQACLRVGMLNLIRNSF
jgi:hypothetical protein